MSKRTAIRLTESAERFNYRIAGLGFRDGHVLVHRPVHEPFWTFPGGRAEIGGRVEDGDNHLEFKWVAGNGRGPDRARHPALFHR